MNLVLIMDYLKAQTPLKIRSAYLVHPNPKGGIMHITEGIITGTSAVGYTGAGAALVWYGIRQMKQFTKDYSDKKPLLGMAGALIFFVSLLPIPAFTGTCSHPCGTPLIGILFGPAIGIALTGGSLLLQAAFFAHGGFGTWGANVIALGVFGCVSGWGIFKLAQKAGLPLWAAGFAGGFIGDVMVYVGSGLILAGELAHAPSPQYSFTGYLMVIYAAYVPTQLPIAIGEMVITGLALQSILKQRPEVLMDLGLIKNPALSISKSQLVGILLMGMILCLGIFSPQPAEATDSSAVAMVSTAGQQVAEAEETGGFGGMDEMVNERLAEEAGLEPKDPFINVEAMGDLWNALLLLAGGFCGFLVGRYWPTWKNMPTANETSG